MKKLLCMVMALVLCLSMAFAAVAVHAEGPDDGTPSTGGTTTGGTNNGGGSNNGGGEDDPTEPTQECNPEAGTVGKEDH